MKKRVSLLCTVLICSASMWGESPALPKKKLDKDPVVTQLQITSPEGTRQLIRESGFAPTGDYTVEVKVKIDPTNTRGLDLNISDSNKKELRIAIGANGIFDYQDIKNPVTLSNIVNSDDFHLFRLAVNEDKMHIYRDNEYVCTQTLPADMKKEDLMIEMDGDFETPEGQSKWSGAQFNPTTADGTFYSGASAITLQSWNTTGWFANYNISGLKPNTAYSLSYWLKFLNRNNINGNQRYDLKLGYYDEFGTFVRVNGLDDWNPLTGTPNATTDGTKATWKQYFKYFNTSEKVTDAIISVCGWTGTNVKNVIDGLSLIQVSNDGIYDFGNENLLVNGNFDNELNGWTATNIGAAKALSEITTENKTLRLYTQGNAVNVANQAGSYSQILPGVQAGDVFQLSFDAKSTFDNTRSAKIEIEELSATGGNLRTVNSIAIPAGTDFNSYTLQHVVSNPDCAQLKVAIYSYYIKNVEAAECFVDNLILKKAASSQPKPYLDYGKAFYFPAANMDMAYLNYDLTGAYAPDTDTSENEMALQDNIFVRSENGKIIIENKPLEAAVSIISTNGIVLYQGNNSEIALPKGGYIIDIKTTEWAKKLTIVHE